MLIKLSDNWVVNTNTVNEIFLTNGGKGKTICVVFTNGEQTDKEYLTHEEAKADFDKFIKLIEIFITPVFVPDREMEDYDDGNYLY